MNVNGKINSIGKEIFVKYYYDFKNCTNKKVLAQKILDENLKATSLYAQYTRISNAKTIINGVNSYLSEAFDIILLSKKISDRYKLLAKQICKNELGKELSNELL